MKTTKALSMILMALSLGAFGAIATAAEHKGHSPMPMEMAREPHHVLAMAYHRNLATFAKALHGAGVPLPTGGAIFVSLRDADKGDFLPVARGLAEAGFALVATAGTRKFLEDHGVPAGAVAKVGQGKPDAADLLKAGTLKLVINTPMGRKSQRDETNIRCQAIAMGVPCITTVEGARAALEGIRALRSGRLTILPLQAWR